MSELKRELIRGLNLWDTTSLVIGTIIGTGIFLKTAVMAQQVGSPALVLLAWLAAGLLSLAGALTYAELGMLMPEAGGEYVFLRKAYGEPAAFLYGWMRLVVGSAGSIACYGVAFATFASVFLPLEAVWARKDFLLFGKEIHWQLGMKQVAAVGIIMLFTVVNCLRVVLGGKIQSVLTAGKVLGIIAIVAGVFLFAPEADWSHLRSPAGGGHWCGFSAFAAAMLAALWAYDGWNNMPMVGGEIKNPQRNVPLGLIIGMFVILSVYALVNTAYFYALPFGEIKTSSSTLHGDSLPVVSKAAITFLGEHGPKLVSVAVILSVIGVLNGSILTSARIPYAMARDGLFFKSFGHLSRESVPVVSILWQGVWAGILALSATFDQLSDSVVFAGFIFYAACCWAVIILRRKMPDAPRPYKTIGYPWVPILFVLLSIWLLVNTFIHTAESKVGLILILLGLPVYGFLRARRAKNPPAA